MYTDPICKTEIDSIEIPENLQSEYEGKKFYFCSPECKLEFEQNPKQFAQAA